MMFLRCLFLICISFNALEPYAQETSRKSFCESFYNSQVEQSKSIDQMLQTLSRLESAKPSIKNYKEVREIWVELTDLVYSAGSFDEDLINKEFSENDLARLKC